MFKAISLKYVLCAVLNSVEQMNKIYLRDASDFSSVVIVDHALGHYINDCMMYNHAQVSNLHYVRSIDHFLTTH